MKKAAVVSFLALLLLTLVAPVFAQETCRPVANYQYAKIFLQGQPDEAFSKAKTEGKPVLIFFAQPGG